MMNSKFEQYIAECVGLWLAEGDNKTLREITFTNNCLELILLFHRNMARLFIKYNLKIRIYVYEPFKKKVEIPLKDVQINYYCDKRATKPYYIWRLASVNLVKKWKNIVEKIKNNENLYAEILRGFFAGEGRVKDAKNSSRVLEISQAKRVICIDKSLQFFNIDYEFSKRHREGYIIRRKENFDKLAKIGIADLHPDKKNNFSNMLKKYKEVHYKNNYLKDEIIKCFEKEEFYTTEQLAKVFGRSKARISEILVELKKENILKNFRVKSKDYWILKSESAIIISTIKCKYLNMLKNKALGTKDMAEEAGVCWKSAFRRLKELEILGLVKRSSNKMWEVVQVNKKVISI